MICVMHVAPISEGKKEIVSVFVMKSSLSKGIKMNVKL